MKSSMDEEDIFSPKVFKGLPNKEYSIFKNIDEDMESKK